jgi:hypothetical protein
MPEYNLDAGRSYGTLWRIDPAVSQTRDEGLFVCGSLDFEISLRR